MTSSKSNTMIVGFLCTTLLAGCATQEGKDQAMGAGAGALGGAALGCLTGFLASGRAGGCATGAAIGAATGAVAGWAAVKISQYHASQVRSAQQEQRLYGLTKPVTTTQIKIRNGSATPNSIRAGESVKLTTDYSVLLPSNQPSTSVTESWILKHDNKVLADVPQTKQRNSGGWVTDATLPIPGNAQPGTYVVEHKVQAGDSYDSDESTFVVAR